MNQPALALVSERRPPSRRPGSLRDGSSLDETAYGGFRRVSLAASLQVPGEKSGRVVPGKLRDAGVPAHVGVQRLLLGAERVEQV